MYKFGLIGYPLSHSMSKIIQEAAFKSCNLEGTYEILETQQEDLVTRLKYLRSNGFQGFNVTIPLKVPVTLFLSEVDNVANIAGSANTIKILPDSSMIGYNTDVYGFVEAIPEDFREEIAGSETAILGNGGAARAVGVGLSILKAKKIDFYARNVLNATEMADVLRRNFKDTRIECKQIESLKDLSNYKILVNTTPIGMRSKAMGISPIDEDVIKTMNPESVIYDIVYNPLKTELINLAKKHNIRTIQGLDMLIYQGAKAFEIWTGKKPDTLKMKIAALEEMAQ
ncbi:MAG: shikimate dehydrogenase [Candidatus Gastranaerophilales bacterium]|nr:shikimate dehydrogenase [Candidatus Gastranaerophilales bacterium]